MVQYNVWEVMRVAIQSGVVTDDSDKDRLLVLAQLLEDVREQALREAMTICNTIAGTHHLSMWEYRSHGRIMCADMEKARVETAELIKRTIKTRINHENGERTKAEGHQASAQGADPAGRAAPGTEGGAGAGSTASGAVGADTPAPEVDGGHHD